VYLKVKGRPHFLHSRTGLFSLLAGVTRGDSDRS
jgi:uncharacterized membrane protein YeaQ/YmgE (transglycosylase-associated protein family)